jgi:hypothetical protein
VIKVSPWLRNDLPVNLQRLTSDELLQLASTGRNTLLSVRAAFEFCDRVRRGELRVQPADKGMTP